MATTSLPVTLSLALKTPLDPGSSQDPTRSVEVALSSKAYEVFRYDLVGAGSKAVALPSNPQLLLLVYESGTASIELDLGTDVITLRPGGIYLVVNPQAATDLPLTINHTASAVIRGTVYS